MPDDAFWPAVRIDRNRGWFKSVSFGLKACRDCWARPFSRGVECSRGQNLAHHFTRAGRGSSWPADTPAEPMSTEHSDAPEDADPAAQAFEKRISPSPSEGIGVSQDSRAGRTTKQQGEPSGARNSCDIPERRRLNAQGPDRQRRVGAAMPSAGEQVLVASRLHQRSGKFKDTDGLAEKGRFPRLGLHHHQVEVRARQRQGNRRRSPT